MNVVTPIVHSNGTSVESLLEAREKVYGVIGDLLSTLAEMAPNGRDYYLEPGRMDRAVAQRDRYAPHRHLEASYRCWWSNARARGEDS